MRSIASIILLIGLSVTALLAQSSGRMETDRPDQAECANVVKAGYVQTEMGFNMNHYGGANEWDIPTTLIKYGVADRVELRYISVLESIDGNTTYRPDAAGIKVFLYSGKNWIPRTTVIGQYHFNDDKRDNSDYNRTHHSIGEIIFTFQNDFSENFGIGYNAGPEFHSDGTVEWIYRVTPGWNISARDFFYLEIFGRAAREQSEVWSDAGLARYLTDNLKVDFSAGINLKGLDKYYVAAGISWRFKLKK